MTGSQAFPYDRTVTDSSVRQDLRQMVQWFRIWYRWLNRTGYQTVGSVGQDLR